MSLPPRKSVAPLKNSQNPIFLPNLAALNNAPKSLLSSLNSLPQVKHSRVKSNNFLESQMSLNNLEPLNSDRLVKDKIQISKGDLTNMLRDIKQDILEETVNKNDKYVDSLASKHNFLDNKVAFTRNEIRQLLRDYKTKISSEIKQDKEQRYNVENAYYQNMYSMAQQYSNFQSLLWYYYIYNPELYSQLINEYNHRLHNQLLGSLGLSEEFSNKEKSAIDKNPAIKFNVSQNTLNDESPPRSPNKSNIRKSLFIGQNPELLNSVVPSGGSLRKSNIGENGNYDNNRKSIYYGGQESKSPFQNAGKMSIFPNENVENPARIRKKSVMPPKEQREALLLADEQESQEKIKKRNTKYVPVLGSNILEDNNEKIIKRKTIMDVDKKSLVPPNNIQRKSLFPQKKMSSIHMSNSGNTISSESSDYDIYGEHRDSIRKGSINKKSSSLHINTEGGPLLKLSAATRKSNVEEREIIVERYNIRIMKSEYEALKYEDIMSDGIMDFFMKYLQEKQTFMSQAKLTNNQLRIFYFPIRFYESLGRRTMTSEQINQMYLPGNSIKNFDKIVIALRKTNNDTSFNFVLAEMETKITRFYEIVDEDLSENSEVLGNLNSFLKNLSGGRGEWKTQMGQIEKITDKKMGALYFCKSVYCISQGLPEMSNREKKIYEFKQKLINLLIKMSKVLDEKGEIEDLRIFDL